MRTRSLIALALLAASPAAAEVTASADTSFTVTQKLAVAAPPAKLWATLVAPASWWNPEHSWSGDAANFSMDARAGGCFCEKLAEGGSVEHLRVLFVQPNKLLRLGGGLGPIQAMPASGVMTFALKPGADGKSTELTVTYAVAGGPGLGKIAAPADGMIAGQLARLKATAER